MHRSDLRRRVKLTSQSVAHGPWLLTKAHVGELQPKAALGKVIYSCGIAKGPGGLTLWVSITHRRGTFNQTSLDLSAESPFASLLLHGAKVSQVLAPEKQCAED